MMNCIARITLCCCLIINLSSCGFHLRNQLPVPPELTTIALISSNPNGQLTQQLWQIFKSTNVHVVTDPDQAPISLYLFNENTTTSLLSESASSATRQYTLTYSISYELQTQHNVVYGPKTLLAFRNYMVNERQVLSTSTEQQLLSTNLQRDIVYQIISQLGSPEVRQLIVDSQESPDENQLRQIKNANE